MKNLLLIVSIIFSLPAKGQVQLTLSLERNFYIAYEPLVVQVALTNLGERDLKLENTGHRRWLGFDIQMANGHWLAPRYVDEPASILKAGSTMTHRVNVTPLFALEDFGGYRISATVFLTDINRCVRSAEKQFEITGGRLLKQQEVSDHTDIRLVSLLVHQLPQSRALYLRIEDKRRGIIYCTHQLGNWVSYSQPEIEIDDMRSVHILQSDAPRKFIYTRVNLDGKILECRAYVETAIRPSLKKIVEGVY